MKIIHITHGKVNPNGSSGISRVVYNLNKNELNFGIKSEIWTIVNNLKKKQIIFRNGIKIVLYPRRYFMISKFLKKDLRKIQNEIDLIHFHMPWLYDKVPISNLCKRLKINYIVTGHSAYSSNQKHGIKKYIAKYLYELKFLNNAKEIRAITQEESTEFVKYGVKVPIFVVHNGVDVIPNYEQYSNKPHDILRFLFIGELRKQKNIDGLIQAVSLLKKAEKEKIIIEIGGPDSRGNKERYKELIRTLNLENNFVFLGPIYGDKKAEKIIKCDIYIQPSHSEVVSLSVIEAMAYGKPCVITRTCDVSYFYNENFFIMCEPTPSSISAAISEAINKQNEFHQMGINARTTFVELFTWEKTSKKIIKNYKRIIENELN